MKTSVNIGGLCVLSVLFSTVIVYELPS